MNLNLKQLCGLDAYVGNTPLIRLRGISELTGCEILGKAEFMNPCGSVKDRAALGILQDGEAKGWLKRGDTIIEASAGNTGISLTLLGLAKGYQTVIVIPETQAIEKIALLRAIGADVITVPERPYDDVNNYMRVAERLATENRLYLANQFDNTANRDAHYRTTGPEIVRQTNGKITAFVSAVGSGGTLAGNSIFLKEWNSQIQIVCADPFGGAMWSWFTHKNLDSKTGSSVSEGIGQTRVTGNLEGIVVDRTYRIPDQAAVSIVYQLLREEGLFLGLSAGINLAAAMRQAKEFGPGQTIVTILCDSGTKYQSKIYNPAWLKQRGLDPDLKIEDISSLSD